jgi:tyrosine-protein kinase Etk/Wzc
LDLITKLESEKKDSFDFKEYAYLLLANWYWILIGLVIAIALAWANLRYATTIYEVSGTVLIGDNKKGGLTETAILTELGYEDNSNIEDQLQIFKSTNLMKRVVDSLGLQHTFILGGRIKDGEVYRPFVVTIVDQKSFEPFSFKIVIENEYGFKLMQDDQKMDSLIQFGRIFRVNNCEIIVTPGKNHPVLPGQEYLIILGDVESTARQLAGNLGIEQIKRTNSIEIILQNALAEKSIDIFHQLVKEYNKSIVEEKNLAGKNTLDFIDERLKYIAEELYDVEKDVQNYKQTNQLPLDLEASSSEYLQELSGFDKQLLELEVQESLIENVLTHLENPAKIFENIPVASPVLGSALSGLALQYNEVLFKRNNLLESATTANPGVATYDEQLDHIRSNIKASVRSIQRDIAGQKASLQRKIKPIEGRISAVPRNERELLQIMRQQKIKETLFLFLLQKREETALTIAAQTSDAKILDNPESKGPVYPNPFKTYLMAFVLGLGIPVSIVVLRKVLNTKIYTRAHIEAVSNIPFLGVIRQAKLANQHIVIKKGSRSAVAELFRLLRTNLQFNAAGSSGQVLLVTSSVSGEGKTFITVNLGITQAQAGKKTILIGLDLRKPKLVNYITGQKETSGVTNFLIDPSVNLENLVKKVDNVDNLYYLGCGPVPPNPSELIMQDQMKALFVWLRENYDYIIIDTAPLGLVTDALLLDAFVDQTLVVTRFGFTTRAYVEMINDLYTANKLVRPGIIINGIKTSGSAGYAYGYGQGYGYGYGYGYGHGYGYYEEDPEK